MAVKDLAIRLTADAEAASRTFTKLNAEAGQALDNLGARGEQAFARLDRAAAAGGRQLGNFSNIARQAGFQIGDVATQISMGGNAIQAFTVQGAQLISMLGGPWAAAAGAAVAVGGALAATFLDVGKKSEEAGDAAKDHAARLEAAAEVMDKINGVSKTRVEILTAERDALLSASAAEVERARAAIEAQRAILAASQMADPETAMGVGGAAGLRIGALTGELDAAAKRLEELQKTFAGSDAKLAGLGSGKSREDQGREDARLQEQLDREALRIATLVQRDWTATAERGARERLEIEEHGSEELKKLLADQGRAVERAAEARARAEERAVEAASRAAERAQEDMRRRTDPAGDRIVDLGAFA